MRDEQELTIADLIEIFRRNWAVIFGVFTLSVLVMCAYTLSKPKLYSYQGLIELAAISDPATVGGVPASAPQASAMVAPHREIDIDEVATLLKFAFSGKSASGSGASLSDVQVQDNGRTTLNPYYESSLISITTTGPTLEVAKNEIEGVVVGLRSALQPKLSQISQDAREQLKDIDDQILSIRTILKEIDQSSKGARDAALSIALSLKRESYQNQMTQLLRERRKLSRMVLNVNQSIRLLAESPVSIAPVSPKLGKGLMLGAILGCVLAFLSVLILEARAKSRSA